MSFLNGPFSFKWTSYNVLGQGYPGGLIVKSPPANAGDAGNMGWILRSRRSPRGGNGNPLHYSCLENSMDRGAWQDTVHGVKRVGCN